MGTEVAKAAKSHKAKTAAVAFVDLPELSAADKVPLKILSRLTPHDGQ